MPGTIDLSIEQFNTIARSISETESDVVRLVISPTTDLGGTEKPVVVKQYSLSYGDVLRSRYAVLRDGKRVPAPDDEGLSAADAVSAIYEADGGVDRLYELESQDD